jgi:GNAT superfamily N-acetyltransferase
MPMQIYKAESLADIGQVPQLSSDEVWDHARRFLAEAPDDPFAHHLRWLEDDGRPVACVQVFLHRYPIGRAQVGVCLPEYPFVPPGLRGRGYFRHLMADLHSWIAANGYPFSYFHGRKGLYAGLGYAPCVHHCMVLLRADDALRLWPSTDAEMADERAIRVHADALRTAFPLGRGLQGRDEGWTAPPGSTWLVHDDGCLRGFAVVDQFVAGYSPADTLTVTDSWAGDSEAAAALLTSLARQACQDGRQWLRLNCRHNGKMARLAVLTGGQVRWSAAQERDCTEDGEDVDAFYVAGLRPALEQMLPELNRRWQRFARTAPPAIVLWMDGERVAVELGPDLALRDGTPPGAPTVALPRMAMTQALIGYARPSDICLLHDGCNVPADCRHLLDALFPALEPHLIHEGTSFATTDQLGLVP